MAQQLLELIKMGDLPDDPSGADGSFVDGFDEPAPEVRESGGQFDGEPGPVRRLVAFDRIAVVTDVAVTADQAHPIGGDDGFKAREGPTGKPVEDGVPSRSVQDPEVSPTGFSMTGIKVFYFRLPAVFKSKLAGCLRCAPAAPDDRAAGRRNILR